MKKLILACLLGAGLIQPGRAQPATDAGVLLNAYMRFVLAREIQAQALNLAKPLAEGEARQVTEQANIWMASETAALRANLDARFAENAKDRFAAFVAEYTAAENQNDLHYLGRLAGDAKLGDTPFEFPAMRKLVLDKWLTDPFQKGSRLLGEMQTWADVRSKNPQAPPLAAWLARDATAPAAPAPPSKPVNPLAAAEAEAAQQTNGLEEDGEATTKG